MHTFALYIEKADEDKVFKQVYIGDVRADTMSTALDLAAQYFEVRQHDLIAVQVDDGTLQKCPWCLAYYEPQHIDKCPLKPKH